MRPLGIICAALLLLTQTACSPAAGSGGFPAWPSSPQADAQWESLKSGEDPFQKEIVVVDPSEGAKPLWNFEALGTPARTIKVGHSYPVKLVEGKKRRSEIVMRDASLYVWQGGVDLNRGAPEPTFTVDLLSSSPKMRIDQPSYWTYSCQASYEYKGENVKGPCRWTNFYSK